MKHINLLFSAVCLLPLSVGAQAGGYYLVDRQKVPLTVSPVSKAVRLRPDLSEEQMRRFRTSVIDSESAKIVEFPGLEKRGYRIILIRPQDGWLEEALVDASVETAFPQIRIDETIGSELTVFYRGGVELIWISQFTIRFNDSVDRDAAQRILAGNFDLGNRLDDVIVPNLSIPEGEYTVSLPELQQQEVLEPTRVLLGKINQLNNRADVEYAYPDFIKIYPPRLVPQAESDASRLAESTEGASAGSSPGCGGEELLSALSVDPNDKYFSNQWALENRGDNPFTGETKFAGQPGADINAVQAWSDFTKGSPLITIAVIDNGVDLKHPDLASKLILPGYDATGMGDANPQGEAHYHGTAVAGLAAAATDNKTEGISGVDWYAKIYPIRMSFGSPTGEAATLPCQEAAAVDEAAAEAQVLINSWHASASAEDQCLNRAIERAIDKGRVVVFSAGNHKVANCILDFATTPPSATCDRTVRYPATLVTTSSHAGVRQALIVVSATNYKDELKTTGIHTLITPHYTDIGVSDDNEEWWGSNFGPEVSLSAPGIHLYTTSNGGGYRCFNGTSGAVPLVGGAAALLLGLHPTATPVQIKDWLQRGADDLGPADRDDFYGYGRLNIAGAFEAAKGDGD